MSPRKAPHSQKIYQLKISLQDISPPIWRSVQLRGNTTLAHLHWVIQVSMGWTNSHLHSFTIDGVEYGMPLPELGFDEEFEPEDDTCYLLGDVAQHQSRFLYRYDFGDSWDHQIRVEQIFKPVLGLHYPRCLYGERACPPEDCGGTLGYQNFLTVIRNPDDEEYQSTLRWVGGSFEPEAFDLEKVNERLEMMPM